jgi:hypothetical protein
VLAPLSVFFLGLINTGTGTVGSARLAFITVAEKQTCMNVFCGPGGNSRIAVASLSSCRNTLLENQRSKSIAPVGTPEPLRGISSKNSLQALEKPIARLHSGFCDGNEPRHGVRIATMRIHTPNHSFEQNGSRTAERIVDASARLSEL